MQGAYTTRDILLLKQTSKDRAKNKFNNDKSKTVITTKPNAKERELIIIKL